MMMYNLVFMISLVFVFCVILGKKNGWIISPASPNDCAALLSLPSATYYKLLKNTE